MHATCGIARAAPKRAGPVGGVVLGGDYQGLGIARSLGRRGVPVCVLDDEHSIARFSRYVQRSVRISNMRDDGPFVEDLLTVGRQLGLDGWVLFPTRDETVAAIARNSERLKADFRVSTASWNTVRWAWDKRNTYRLAETVGVPTPRTWRPRSGEDLEAIDGEPPFAVKPAIKENFLYATKVKAWRADSAHELRLRWRDAVELVGPAETMIQEFIPGDGSYQYAYCALWQHGRPVATMTARRLRQHPPEFGRASTFVETLDEPKLEELSERLLRAIDYDGLVELEYKRDPRDRRFKLLDFNARTWGYHTIAPAAGVDFAYLAYKQQLGGAPEPRRATPGVRWVRLLTDLPTAVVQLANRQLRARAYLRSLRSAHVEAVFSRTDPLPGLVELSLIPYLSVKRGF